MATMFLSFALGCSTESELGTTSQGLTADANLAGIDLSDEGCNCADAFLKNLNQKLIEAQKLKEAAKNSVTSVQEYMETLNEGIKAERDALNEVVASDIAMYQGIAIDAAALVLDVAVPSSALVRRTACVAGKKAANVFIKKTLATVVKKTTIDNPVRKGLRRVAVARVIEGTNNGVTEALTWIPVVGPAVEMFDKFKGLRKRSELMETRKQNLVALVADYDEQDVLLKKVMAEAEQYDADIANLLSKISSFTEARAQCEAFAYEPETLESLGIDPTWPPGWADVFYVHVEPKPIVCEEAWVMFTGSSRLSRLWGSRDAINAAKAQAESMCFNNPMGQVPNPSCVAPYTQQRTAFYDLQGGQNPSGDRHGAGCGTPREYGSSTVWSDPLTEVDCWCFRKTCCAQGATPVAVEAQAIAIP